MFIVNPLCIYPGMWQALYRGCINHFSYFFLRWRQCSFSIRHEVLPDVNCQFRGFDDEVDVLSQMISPSFTRLIKSSTTCVALHNIFHCDKNKLTPYLVGIVSVSQNLRSTLLLPFHSVSSVYLPPPRSTLTESSILGFDLWRTLLLRLPVPDPLGSGWTECSMLWSGLLILIYVTCRMKCESLLSCLCFS